MSVRKSPSYLFGKAARARLADHVDGATLFAFDLDGTLAPIVSDPAKIGIPATVWKAFAALNEQAAVAVITGRSRSDALMHLGLTPRYVIGNHGAEGLPGWACRENEFVQTTQAWQNQLDALLPPEDTNGILLENKGATLSVHYRHAVNIQAAQAVILHAVDQLVPPPRRISGTFVENLLPAGAPDKGVALSLLMQQEGFEKGFFTGDDETDESIFRLDHESIFTVRVGKIAGSRARFYLRGQYEVGRLLRMLNSILENK